MRLPLLIVALQIVRILRIYGPYASSVQGSPRSSR